jgi:hypothetical protein
MTIHICIQLLALEQCWSISTWSSLTILLTALILLWSTANLFTYLKKWSGSQRLKNNELIESVKTWLSSQLADFFDIGIQNLFPYDTNASVLAVTTLKSSISIYICFVYNNFFVIACFVNSSPKVAFWIALVYHGVSLLRKLLLFYQSTSSEKVKKYFCSNGQNKWLIALRRDIHRR